MKAPFLRASIPQTAAMAPGTEVTQGTPCATASRRMLLSSDLDLPPRGSFSTSWTWSRRSRSTTVGLPSPILWTRSTGMPLSRRKRWRLVEILRQVG